MFIFTFNIFSLSITISVIIALTFGTLILIKNANRAEKFLASLMFIVALWNLSILILDLNLYRYIEGIIWLPLSFTLALGPCFYFYIHFISDFEINNKLKIWPHFIPVLFEILFFLIEVFQGLPEGKAYFETDIFFIVDPIINFLSILSFSIYGYIGIKRINAYHHWVENNYSNYHKYNLNWLLRLCSFFVSFLIIWLGYFIADFIFYAYSLSIEGYYPFHLSLAVMSIWMSVEAFNKPNAHYFGEDTIAEIKSKLSVETEIEFQEKSIWLKKQIEENLLYLDPELSLNSIAETLNIHQHLVSKIFNVGLKSSFSDFINKYRVNAVINKLKSEKGKNATLLAIAFDCGFNSKTTFNRVFKKHTGFTPRQYRNGLGY